MPDPQLASREQNIRALIDAHPFTPEQKYAWAVRFAAHNLANAENERLYRLAYGSQLALLRNLNGMVSLPLAGAMQFFEDHRDRAVSIPTYTFELWLRFLQQSGLVVSVDSPDGPLISITLAGQGLLSWMVTQRVPDQKAF